MPARPRLLPIAAAVAGTLAAALALAPAGARAESTLVVCTEASPDALNPQLSSANTSFDVGEQTSDRLVEMRTGGSELRPGLATAWEVSADGLRVTFHLRPGVAWQSNAHFQPTRAMDASDVVFSFHRMMDRSDPFYRSANGTFPEFQVLLQSSLQDVAAVDAQTVAFTLKAPLSPLPALLTMQPMGIVSAEYAADALKAGHPEWLDQEPIGTGPFSLVRYAKDSQLRFRAFPGFWGRTGQPDRVAGVDTLVFSITPDASVRWAKLRAGECQVARYPNPADLPAMRADPGVVVQAASIAALDYIGFDTAHKPFDDRRVRQALAMAIDVDALVQAVYQGTGVPTAALIPPALWGHDAGLRPYAHDPVAAKRLLAEAGYPDGFRTQLWAIPVVRAYMPDGRRAAEMIQADWAKVGVKASIVTYEWGEYLRRVRSGEAPVGMLGGTWDYPDPSEEMVGFLCGAPLSLTHWCSHDYDAAVRQAGTLTDRDARTKLYLQAQQAMHDDVPILQFADVKAYVPVRRSVHGFVLHFLGGQPFGGVSVGP